MIDRTASKDVRTLLPPEEAPVSERVRAIRRRMALAMLPPLPPQRLGTITLLVHQQQAAARLLRILSWHRGALLSDDVGLGKTFTALAVAQRYGQVHVLAPAALVTMWQAALLRTEQRHVSVHSLHRYSRQAPPPFNRTVPNAAESASRPLIIVDEAHALRNPSTVRYRNLATAVAGCDVLLISATPLHNSPRDLHALVALFRGQRADTLRPQVLASLIVRREQALVRTRAPRSVGAGTNITTAAADIRPEVATHRALVVPQDRQTLDLLLALPAPLAAHEGAVAGALIRLGLLRAWCSSDAALAQALARRLQRGSAMRDALLAGRHPTGAELRAWVIGEDGATDMQLGFPELLAQHTVPQSSAEAEPRIDVLDRHLDALRRLREHHGSAARADAVRSAMLRTVRERHAGVSVVAFSQYSRTVQALYRALSDIAGVGMLTGNKARIASGAVSRTELLEHFAPLAHGRPPPPAHQLITLLLTTDLIAEGVNLQDAGVVIHLDLPWTHALRTQRTGRVARLGSCFPVVHEYRVQAGAAARRALRAEIRVAQKAALTAKYVGGTPADQRESAEHAGSTTAGSAADVASQWLQHLDAWTVAVHSGHTRDSHRLAVQAHRGAATAALVLTLTTSGHQLLAVIRQGGRWLVSTQPASLLQVAVLQKQVTTPTGVATEVAQRELRQVQRVVRRWHTQQRARQLVGLGTLTPTGCAPPPGPAQRRALAWLQRVVARLSTVKRQQHAPTISTARLCIRNAVGVASEQALGEWMRSAAKDPLRQLNAWREHDVLVRGVQTGRRVVAEEEDTSGHSGEVACCLLYVGADAGTPPLYTPP